MKINGEEYVSCIMAVDEAKRFLKDGILTLHKLDLDNKFVISKRVMKSMCEWFVQKHPDCTYDLKSLFEHYYYQSWYKGELQLQQNNQVIVRVREYDFLFYIYWPLMYKCLFGTIDTLSDEMQKELSKWIMRIGKVNIKASEDINENYLQYAYYTDHYLCEDENYDNTMDERRIIGFNEHINDEEAQIKVPIHLFREIDFDYNESLCINNNMESLRSQLLWCKKK